ncbi:hypothetical protein D9M72_486450 [compost metagenome]
MEDKVSVSVIKIIHIRIYVMAYKSIKMPIVIEVYKVGTLTENGLRSRDRRITRACAVGFHKSHAAARSKQ